MVFSEALTHKFQYELRQEASEFWLNYEKSFSVDKLFCVTLKSFNEDLLKTVFNKKNLSNLFENLEEFIDESLTENRKILFGLTWNDSINACALKIDSESSGVIINNFVLFLFPLISRAFLTIKDEKQKAETVKFLCDLDACKLYDLTEDEQNTLVLLMRNPLDSLEIFIIVSILEFLSLHEIGHIVLKHFDYDYIEEYKMFAFGNDEALTGFNYSQKQEMEADKFACNILKKISLYRIEKQKWSKEKIVVSHVAISFLMGYFLYTSSGKTSLSHPPPIDRTNQYLKIWEEFGNNISLEVLNLFKSL